MQFQKSDRHAGWQSLGGSFVFELPPMTVAEFVSRSGSMLIVMPDGDGGYHLSELGIGTSLPCPDFGVARAYADDRVASILATRSDSMVREIGLDPAAWSFKSSDRFIYLESVDRPRVRLERHAENRWAVVIEGMTVGFASTPDKALALLDR